MEKEKVMRPRPLLCVLVVLFALTVTGLLGVGAQERPAPDVPYVVTPDEVVEEMLRIAGVTEKDVVYDLGSGDGRIVITAAKRLGARGVGVEIDPDRVRLARDHAQRAGIGALVRFVEGDIFAADIREATVVTMYLLPGLNRRLRPKLLDELQPGTRIVSHDYDMGDWAADKVVRVGRSTIYFWVVPARSAGGQDSRHVP
jgi:SAM-dependent methyltransferase